MSPHVRRVAHEALDMILDAIAQEHATPAKKPRRRPNPPIPVIKEAKPELDAKVNRALKRAGLL
ncbi:MAG: hypothetical protein KF850_24330 [Labilithrix sp.]|nr:hypothetical protein [Labilithrix sp.]